MSPGGPYELKIEGNGIVRRFFPAATAATADTPAIRRIAPRKVSLIFMISLVRAGTLARDIPLKQNYTPSYRSEWSFNLP
jgi:hypothetical protein